MNDELDILRIGKFEFKDGRVIPINDYAEKILNNITININDDPKQFIRNIFSDNIKLINISSMKLGVAKFGDFFYFLDLTDYLNDMNNFIDLLSMQHEIKNPLTVINGASQLLKLRFKDSFVQHTADIITKESGRIQHLLDSISVLFKNLKIDTVILKSFLEELISATKMIYPDVEIGADIDPEISKFRCDKEQFYIAIFNILKNSCDAYSKTKINISVSIDASMKMRSSYTDKTVSMIKFSISDLSGGIKNEDVNKIFNPFFTTKSKGGGLGLFIAKNIIEKHNGRIFFNTLYKYGTTFNILIPYSSGELDDKSVGC
ncbi:MAG: HAMP domain-containing histidine kinase [Calditerrivibrio sp.]|nr:HAMP domain-containing histidine kinase [Calditerrivibrio sp.]